MIIDFHVHFFPDSIAQRTTSELGKKASLQPNGDGSLQSLARFMETDQIDISFNMPVATKPEQVTGINRKMVELNKTSKNVISFGAMHPEFHRSGNVKEELHYLAENGVKGIKLHPEYQSFYPDDPNMALIYETCRDLKLVILLHAGRDIAFETVHATPRRIAEIARIQSLSMVLAHMGGYRMWDDVEQYLVGLKGVYFDTAFTTEMENWQMKEIILGHSPFKILFGSDFPWQRASDVVAKVKELCLGKDFEEQIFHRNAKKLLHLES